MEQMSRTAKVVTRMLQKQPRLPSHIHAAAVAKLQLLSDQSQTEVLPVLDSLVHQLPAYDDEIRKHAKALLTVEHSRSIAEQKETQRKKKSAFLHRLGRLVSGVSPTAHPSTLPNSYYRLPEIPPAPTPPRGVYLHGDVGCGKSLLMDMLFTSAESEISSSARVHYHAFMISVYQMIHQYDLLSEAERARLSLFHPLDAVVGRLGRATTSGTGGGLLCFDEFQVADVADARLMHGIFDRLMRAGTVVCFTANRAPGDVNRSQLRDKDFIPFLDLMHDRCQLIHIESGIDYREELSSADESGVQCYFDGDDETALQKAWRDVTASEWDDVHAHSLTVAYGRQFEIERANLRARAVQMSTEDLIEAAVGASDYRALAKFATTIFLTDVLAVFTSDTRNYARRFITLIDVCYEEKVRIMMRMEAKQLDEMFNQIDVSAFGAEIAEGLQFESEVAKQGVGADNRAMSSSSLYTGEDEAFAFRRAVSRLKEMQTTSFGKRENFR